MIDHHEPEPRRPAPPGKIKISCHSCGARYLLPQERVRGRRFRVKCRECDGVIVASCEQGSVTVMPAHDGSVSAQQRPPEDDVWYVGIAGQPHGPHTELEIAQLLGSAEITRKSHVWRAGFADWERIEDVELFQEHLLDLQLTEIFAADEQPPDSVPQLSLSRLARASTVEHQQREQELTLGPEDHDEDGYESFAGASQQRGATADEDDATSLRARAEDAQPQLVLLDGASDGFDLEQLEALSESTDRSQQRARPALDAGPESSEAERADAPGDDSALLVDAVDRSSRLQVSGRWRRPTALGTGTAAPGKLETGAWVDVEESGIHDKRITGRAWTGEADAEERSRWTGAGRRQSTLSMHSAEETPSVDPRQVSALGEEAEEHLSLPSAPSTPLLNLGDTASELSVVGAKLPTEMLRLIPRKVTQRPQREQLPRPSFAPPVPQEAIPPASPSLLVRRKPRAWSRGRVVAIISVALLLCSGAAVAAYLLLSHPDGGGQDPPVKAAAVAVSPAPQARGRAEPAAAVATQPAVPDSVHKTQRPAPEPQISATALPERAQRRATKSSSRRARQPSSGVEAPVSAWDRRRAAREARRRRRALRRERQAARAPRPVRRAPAPRAPAAPDPEPQVVVGSASAIIAATPDEGVQVPDPDEILALGTLSAQKKRRTAAAAAGLPETLTKAQIQRVMRQLRPKVIACFDKHGNGGTLKLRLTVQPYGRAVGKVIGPLAGTPTAACVVAKLPQIRFDRFTGDPITFTYPYALQ